MKNTTKPTTGIIKLIDNSLNTDVKL